MNSRSFFAAVVSATFLVTAAQAADYSVDFQPLNNNETGSRIRLQLPAWLPAPTNKPDEHQGASSTYSSWKEGTFQIIHKRYDIPLDQVMNKWMGASRKWEQRWATREIQGATRCLAASGRFPPTKDFPAEYDYLITCEPAGGGNGLLVMTVSVLQPPWEESYDAGIVAMLESLKTEPLRKLPAAAEIKGKIASIRENSVKIEFTPSGSAGPLLGDVVLFQIQRAGMDISGGKGAIIGVASDFAWAHITEGQPVVGMTALIQAYGKPGKPGEYLGENISEGRLQMENVEGVFEMLLPEGFRPHIHHPESPEWSMDSLMGGLHLLSPDRPEGPTPDWEINVRRIEYPRNITLQQLHDGGYNAYMHGDMSSPNYKERWKNRAFHGATTCLGWSFVDDSDREGERLDARKWQIFCEDARGQHYVLFFWLYGINWTDEDDQLIDRMVRSFKPLR